VVKSLRFRLLKLVVVLIVLVFCWVSPAIASPFSAVTHQNSATRPPDDLQSLVIQTADSLDLPLFPLNDSDTNTQVEAQANDWEEEVYLASPRPNAQTSQTPALGNAGSSATKP
jgi:hypothetical protein